jgi:diadenosine tetraphosphate (Ap4A) HIT family hydrolase
MNNHSFILDYRLQQDTVFISDGVLSRIGLMNDSRYPWLILVPRIANAREWTELSESQQLQLQAEINTCAKALQQVFPIGTKLNIAALGNVVSQLHIHVILRHENDGAWPNPVWGFGQRTLYADSEIEQHVSKLSSILNTTNSP